MFSNAEKCKTTAITSTYLNKLPMLSYGINYISHIQLNVVEKLHL